LDHISDDLLEPKVLFDFICNGKVKFLFYRRKEINPGDTGLDYMTNLDAQKHTDIPPNSTHRTSAPTLSHRDPNITSFNSVLKKTRRPGSGF